MRVAGCLLQIRQRDGDDVAFRAAGVSEVTSASTFHRLWWKAACPVTSSYDEKPDILFVGWLAMS